MSTSVGVDKEVGRRLSVALVYVHKNGRHFIGWHDTGGHSRDRTRTLLDGRALLVHELVNSPSDRRFLLTNAAGYSLDYDGLAIAVEKRRAHGWQAFGSYTLSRASGSRPPAVPPPQAPSSAPWRRLRRRASTSDATRTTSPTRMASCRMIVRTC